MKIISWNCRELGRPRAVRALTDLIRAQHAPIVGLFETKLSVVDCEYLRVRLNFNYCFSVGRKGRSGGLALLWKADVDVNIRSYSNNHIDAFVDHGGGFNVTMFYGNPRVHLRTESWDLLRRIRDRIDKPWVVMGDFNEVLFSWEMQSKRRRNEQQMMAFREVVMDCSLFDLGCRGKKFTFSNRRRGDEETRVRLDRIFANEDWKTLFPKAVSEAVDVHTSDHCALVLNLYGGEYVEHRATQREFKFEPMWFRERSFKHFVRSSWVDIKGKDGNLVDKLKDCGSKLTEWNSTVFGNVQKNIKLLKKEIQDLRNKFRTEDIIKKEEEACSRLDEWLAREELLWKQRARTDWLKGGDNNTVFFKLRASRRKERKLIDALELEDGSRLESTDDIMCAFMTYFINLFSSSPSTREQCTDWEAIMRHVKSVVTPEMNQFLSSPFYDEEVAKALFDMKPEKAPGPDGFSAGFFQKFWPEVKDEVIKEVLGFLNRGVMDSRLNETNIILLPKKKEAVIVGDFRPISLCNVVLKIITKTLANRLSSCLPSLISEFQSAFIKHRLISDNIILAHEACHHIRKRNKGLKGIASVKIDMSKAYDRVEWNFLETLMNKMGFNSIWVEKVMKCVTSVSYRVCLNGRKSGVFKPLRGLRQGDPLSPFLFILCQDWLSGYLTTMQEMGCIRGIRLESGIPRMNHLFFADDCLIFVEAELYQLANLKESLRLYEQASGQQINLKKSEFMVSPNIDVYMRTILEDFLGMKQVLEHSKYLGLPMAVGQNKRRTFSELEDKIEKKVSDWRNLTLSWNGRATLIKACIQAVPLFTMNCMKLPKAICNSLSCKAIDFWWNGGNDKRKIHWVRKEVLQREKEEGGLGFRCFDCFNDAMLMKQLWRLYFYPDLLVSRILRRKYVNRENGGRCSSRAADSFVWKSLCSVWEVFMKGMSFDHEGLGIRWIASDSGFYSVKSGYKLAFQWNILLKSDKGESSNRAQVAHFWKNLWRARVPERVKCVTWRLAHNALPLIDRLRDRGIVVQGQCVYCGSLSENALHLFVECWWVKSFWNLLGITMWPRDSYCSLLDWLWDVMTLDLQISRKVMAGIWMVWNNRCRAVFGKDSWSSVQSAHKVSSLLLQSEIKGLLGQPGVEDECFSTEGPCIMCDGSFSKEYGRGGFAAIVLEGKCVIACELGCLISSSVFVSELSGVLAGFRLAMTCGIEEVSFMTDSVEVIWALQSGFCSDENAIEILKEGIAFLSRFKKWKMVHSFRERLRLVDFMAKKARLENLSWKVNFAIPIWMGSLLDSLQSGF